uniref:Uncharacterized protein n=1 Tax=Octopus bimaculoides TaxID=37653 RepID=A0A0L8I4M2_OCTBM
MAEEVPAARKTSTPRARSSSLVSKIREDSNLSVNPALQGDREPGAVAKTDEDINRNASDVAAVAPCVTQSNPSPSSTFNNINNHNNSNNNSSNSSTSSSSSSNNNNNNNINNNHNNHNNKSARIIANTTETVHDEPEEEELPYPGFVPTALYCLNQTNKLRWVCLKIITWPYPFKSQ